MGDGSTRFSSLFTGTGNNGGFAFLTSFYNLSSFFFDSTSFSLSICLDFLISNFNVLSGGSYFAKSSTCRLSSDGMSSLPLLESPPV